MYLHQRPDFKELIEIAAEEESIDSYLVEKDYWIMHCLYGLSQLNLKMELKGGTSLSKAYRIIHRFSEDIDIKILPDEKIVGFKVYSQKNHDKPKHRESRKDYFNYLAKHLEGKIDGVENVARDITFDGSVDGSWKWIGLEMGRAVKKRPDSRRCRASHQSV